MLNILLTQHFQYDNTPFYGSELESYVVLPRQKETWIRPCVVQPLMHTWEIHLTSSLLWWLPSRPLQLTVRIHWLYAYTLPLLCRFTHTLPFIFPLGPHHIHFFLFSPYFAYCKYIINQHIANVILELHVWVALRRVKTDFCHWCGIYLHVTS